MEIKRFFSFSAAGKPFASVGEKRNRQKDPHERRDYGAWKKKKSENID
jgi:hypothetical protein